MAARRFATEEMRSIKKLQKTFFALHISHSCGTGHRSVFHIANAIMSDTVIANHNGDRRRTTVGVRSVDGRVLQKNAFARRVRNERNVTFVLRTEINRYGVPLSRRSPLCLRESDEKTKHENVLGGGGLFGSVHPVAVRRNGIRNPGEGTAEGTRRGVDGGGRAAARRS